MDDSKPNQLTSHVMTHVYTSNGDIHRYNRLPKKAFFYQKEKKEKPGQNWCATNQVQSTHTNAVYTENNSPKYYDRDRADQIFVNMYIVNGFVSRFTVC